MKPLLIAGIALTLASCAPIPNTSRTILTRPILDQFSIGGPQYPVVIQGAEAVGLTPNALAQSLRFPARLRAESSFRAAKHTPGLVDHAHLDITVEGDTATALLSFRHGERRIGVGTFTLRRAAFQDPGAVGSISAVLIDSLLREAQEELRDSDNTIWIPN